MASRSLSTRNNPTSLYSPFLDWRKKDKKTFFSSYRIWISLYSSKYDRKNNWNIHARKEIGVIFCTSWFGNFGNMKKGLPICLSHTECLFRLQSLSFHPPIPLLKEITVHNGVVCFSGLARASKWLHDIAELSLL